MPFRSQAQAGWAFANKKPWAKRWARQTGPYKRLPYKVRQKALAELATLKDYDAAGALAEALALKGTKLAPGVTRIHGDLCNVHGRWGSCRAAGYGGADSKRVAPKQLPKAPTPKKAGGGKGGKKGSAAKPRKTEAERQAERDKKQQERQQAKQQEKIANRKNALDKLASKPNQASMDALDTLAAGGSIDPDMAKALADETGLVTIHQDGTATLAPTGRAFLNALDRGDAGAAADALSRAQDAQASREERATATRDRQAAADQRKRDAAARRQAGGSGGGSKKQPAPRTPRQPRQSAPRGASSAPPKVATGGGGGGGRQAQPQQDIPQALRDAVQTLSDGGELDQDTIDALIRNGLVRLDKNGKPYLTGQGLRVLSRGKAFTPTRTTDAGHTGVMVALYPDQVAAKAIATTEGVTEPIEQLHLTLCFLGDSTEQPLATNKDRLINGMREWATAHGQPLKGTINGLGRFYHSEEDNTNAVYVAPDVPGLPELRQSLVEAIDASGFDYAQNHGFTPHITVAYVPEGAPTPQIRVETPVVFDHVTVAWGDEQYDFPLGIAQKSFAVFKDAAGAWRWLARTTTAFEDRDKEVISVKALADSAASDAPRGPLRWWHMGSPRPTAEQPWGPGVDLGWCDFAALHGRTLIESGTFKSEAIAKAVAAKADRLELSPGFFHAIGEPDASGVFHHIRIFERSLVPTWAGRASNLYTGLKVQGGSMDEKKVQALKELGAGDDVITALLGDVQQAEKSADAQGVRYKAFDWFKALITGEQPPVEKAAEPESEPAPVAEAQPEDPLLALKAQVDALTAELAALKAGPPAAAAMPVDAEDDPAMGGDSGADEAMEEDAAGGLTLSPEDLAAIGQAVGAALEPLVGALGITQKLEGHLGELKTVMGGYVKQKDDEAAQRTDEIAALKASIDQQQAKLAELLGEQPRGASYRPSQAADNTPAAWANPQIQAAVKGAQPDPNDFSDLARQFFPGLLPE